MKHFHIGLDFGTYQTKACVYCIENDTHEFFRFPNGTFFLPSLVAKTEEGNFIYGNNISDEIKEKYSYFKIAAAEDKEFHIETYNGSNITDSNFYQFSEFKNFSPEFLSVVYLTNILFLIKEQYKKQPQNNVKKGGLLSRLFKSEKKVEEDVRFTIQLGIPTEWSQAKNYLRKRKFENILMLAELLQAKYKISNVFLDSKASQLVADVRDIYHTNKFSDQSEFDLKLNDLGISVYPETAAGLSFIVKTRQLLPGYYSIMDIGGGSTDISFFSVNNDFTIQYLASESYMMASNNVYSNFSGSTKSLADLKKAEISAQKLIDNKVWDSDPQLKAALKDVNNKLKQLTYKLFNKRVYYFKGDMVSKYKDQPIIIYGGGANLPILSEGKIDIFDNGNKTSLTIPVYNIEKQPIKKFTSIINILPNDKSWEKDFSILPVALGLSLIKPSNSADWFNDAEYQSNDGDQLVQVPHPINEGFYIYDVINSKWQ